MCDVEERDAFFPSLSPPLCLLACRMLYVCLLSAVRDFFLLPRFCGFVIDVTPPLPSLSLVPLSPHRVQYISGGEMFEYIIKRGKVASVVGVPRGAIGESAIAIPPSRSRETVSKPNYQRTTTH